MYCAPPNALNIRNPQEKIFFEGQGLVKRNNFKGRDSELIFLHQVVEFNSGEPATVFISGIEGMGYVTFISLIIPFPDNYSSKTSSIHSLRMPTMPSVDVIAIMETVRDSEGPGYSKYADIYKEDTLISVAGTVSGHPSAAIIAVKYIVRAGSLMEGTSAGRDFVAMFESPNVKLRRHFLYYRPDDTPSVLETFLISKKD